MASRLTLAMGASLEKFEFNANGLHELIAVPVMDNLIKRAIRVEAAAKLYTTGVNGGPMSRTGRLHQTITWRPGVDPLSPFVDVGTSVIYAPFVELGTSRNKAYPYLRPALEFARADV
jgi:hypothetical protein